MVITLTRQESLTTRQNWQPSWQPWYLGTGSNTITTVTSDAETESVDCDVTEVVEIDSILVMLSSPVSDTAKAALLSHKLFDYYLLPGSSTLVIQRLYLPVAVHSLSSTSRGCHHQPLRRLVLVCTLTKASPTETQEIKFVTMLCEKEPATFDLVYASN